MIGDGKYLFLLLHDLEPTRSPHTAHLEQTTCDVVQTYDPSVLHTENCWMNSTS